MPSQLWKETYRSLASGHPKLATTELLLQGSVDRDYDWTPMLDAALKFGEPEVVKLLLPERRAEQQLIDAMALFKSLSTADQGRMEAIFLFLTDERVRCINPRCCDG